MCSVVEPECGSKPHGQAPPAPWLWLEPPAPWPHCQLPLQPSLQGCVPRVLLMVPLPTLNLPLVRDSCHLTTNLQPCLAVRRALHHHVPSLPQPPPYLCNMCWGFSLHNFAHCPIPWAVRFSSQHRLEVLVSLHNHSCLSEAFPMYTKFSFFPFIFPHAGFSLLDYASLFIPLPLLLL